MTEGKKAAHYWVQEFQAELAGGMYRFIVVRSSSLDKTKKKTLARLLKKEEKELEMLVANIAKKDFRCEPDARARLDSILKNHNMLHGLTGTIVENINVKRKPGGPRKDHDEEPVTTITFGIALEVRQPSEEGLEDWRQHQSAFVLITSVPDWRYDDYDVLKEYKKQVRVEVRFRFLKDPMFVNAIYLKTPKRVEALGYVILLAVMIASLLELRIRNGLEREKSTVSVGPRKKLKRPTARLLLDFLNSILVVYVTHEGRTERHFPHDIHPEILRLLRLAGYNEHIYTRKAFEKLP